MFVDVHTHVDFEAFDEDRDAVIERAEEAGALFIICNGVNLETNKRILELAKKHPLVKPALGLYPTDAAALDDSEINATFKFIEEHIHECVALGEIGLDYFQTTDPVDFEKQKKVLLRFFDLAKKYDKPIILHSRKAEADVVELAEKSGLKKIIFHCFSGKFSLVKRIEQNGFFMSIPPIIMHAGQFQKMAKEVSLKNLLTETDAPFLSPIKGERNEPKNITYTIKKIAEIRGLNVDEVEKMLFMNAQKLFL